MFNKFLAFFNIASGNEPREVSEIVADIQNKVNEFDARISYDAEQIKKVEEDRVAEEELHRKKMEELESKQTSHKESMEWAARVKSRMSDFIA